MIPPTAPQPLLGLTITPFCPIPSLPFQSPCYDIPSIQLFYGDKRRSAADSLKSRCVTDTARSLLAPLHNCSALHRIANIVMIDLCTAIPPTLLPESFYVPHE
jgi:hypothetical protein